MPDGPRPIYDVDTPIPVNAKVVRSVEPFVLNEKSKHMAYEQDERRSTPSIFGWFIGMAALVGILGMMFWLIDRPMPPNEEVAAGDQAVLQDDEETSTGMAAPYSTQDRPAVTNFRERYSSAVDEGTDTRHERTNEGLNDLANALEELARQEDAAIDEHLRVMRRNASVIPDEWRSEPHLERIGDAFQAAGEAMAALDKSGGYGLDWEVQRFQDAVADLEEQEVTVDQRGTVRTLFHRAYTVIERMDDVPSTTLDSQRSDEQ